MADLNRRAEALSIRRQAIEPLVQIIDEANELILDLRHHVDHTFVEDYT